MCTENRARSVRSKQNGAQSATIDSRVLGALKLTSEACDENIPVKRRDFLTYNILFLLAGHKVDFIAPCEANKSIFFYYDFFSTRGQKQYIVQQGGKVDHLRRVPCLHFEVKASTHEAKPSAQCEPKPRKVNIALTLNDLTPCCTRYFIQQKHVFLAFCKVCHLSPAGVNREWGGA